MTTTPIFFFFNDTATTEIYTLSLHDALPISGRQRLAGALVATMFTGYTEVAAYVDIDTGLRVLGHHAKAGVDVNVRGHLRSEEHTSELQSQSNLVCRLLLEKKNKNAT